MFLVLVKVIEEWREERLNNPTSDIAADDEDDDEYKLVSIR